MSAFSLRDENGVLLLDLPHSLRPVGPLGDDDPYTWDKMPGGKRFALGTGDGPIRPVFELAGTTFHRSVAEAAALGTSIMEALRLTRALYFADAHLATLEEGAPGVYKPEFRQENYAVQHFFRLNTISTVTLQNFTGGVIDTPVTTTPGTNTNQPVLTTITVMVEGVPMDITVWREYA